MNIMSNVAVENAQAAEHSHDDHGHDQGGAVREVFIAEGYEAVDTARDLEQRERVTSGRVAHRPRVDGLETMFHDPEPR